MSLYVITVEATDTYTELINVIVLADGERGARIRATEHLLGMGFTEAHSVAAEAIDPFKARVIAITNRHPKEVAS